MPCTHCQLTPHTHNFTRLGRTRQGIQIIRSKPFEAKETKFTEATVQAYCAHMDEFHAEGPWIWVFDAKDIDRLERPKLKHLRQLLRAIETRYATSLQAIVILHMSLLSELIVQMIQPFMSSHAKKRLHTNPSKLECIALGIDAECIHNIYNQDRIESL